MLITKNYNWTLDWFLGKAGGGCVGSIFFGLIEFSFPWTFQWHDATARIEYSFLVILRPLNDFWARQEVSGAAFIFYFLKPPFHGLSNGTWPMEKRKCAYQGVKNVRFSENLACFVFSKYPFWDSPFCLIADELILSWFWTCWTFMITNKFTNLTFFLNKLFIFWS